MYLAAIQFSDRGGNLATRLIDPATFAETFREYARAGMTVVVDDDQVTETTDCSIAEWSFMFFGKDKSTVVKALKACPPAFRFIPPPVGSVAYCSGAYDNEKFGGWFRAREVAAAAWSRFKATPEGRQKIADGRAKKAHVNQLANRARLLSRGYYVLVTSQVNAPKNGRHVGVHGGALSANNLARLLTGKMTREEAVDQLMADLLL